ncbi:hypothetical protein [Salisediminibacterium beveridgei]|nr:hypothetical protein [Salisediminibacterium beveridgei]
MNDRLKLEDISAWRHGMAKAFVAVILYSFRERKQFQEVCEEP